MKVELITILQKLLSIYNVPILVSKKPYIEFIDYFELRSLIHSDMDWEKEFNVFFIGIALKSMNIYRDYLGIHFILFILPNHDYVIIGPYRLENQTFNENQLLEFGYSLENIEALRRYFYSVSSLEEKFVHAQLVSIISTAYPIDKFDIKYFSEYTPLNIIPSSIAFKEKKSALTMEKVEQRYKIENTLLDAVRLGDVNKAMSALNQMKKTEIVHRFYHSLRAQKNSLIIVNTLLRKEIEKANVHPFYIDEISSKYSKDIELVSNENELIHLSINMIEEYCEYVHKYSLKQYSPTVQKMIHYIHMNLTQEISLEELSKQMNMNVSYISNLFKKETGMTIIYYLNHQRINHAAYLLRNTQYNISDIAQQVGIYDLNYFSRIFKKYIGSTPTQYRKMIIK